jgi:heme exporter protein D
MLDLDMAPYAAFVWPAWGVSALVLAALVARAVIASRRWKRELERLETSSKIEAADSLRPQVARSAIGPQK